MTPNYRASIRCVGLKKRASKMQKHNITLGYYSTDASIEALKLLALATLNQQMKTFAGAELSLDYVELEETEKDSLFGPIVRWSPFDEKTKAMSKVIKL